MSAVMKAIKVTKDNKSRLEMQYGLDTDYLEFSSGLYLVSNFGEDAIYEGLFTKANYEARFTETGNKLNNDYVEVTPK